MSAPLLEIRRLSIEYPGATITRVLNGLDLKLARGECLGLVGESGAGKSQLALAVLGLLPGTARLSGEIRYAGVDLVPLPAAERAARRGRDIALVMQDAGSALAPHLTIAHQLGDVLITCQGVARAAVAPHARRLLERVRIPDADRRLAQYPHELSGGLRQRVLIALALAAEPKLLIADEPTTALDVTLERELMDLFAELRRELSLTLLFISHDLGLVASLCDRVAVLYAGRLVEEGAVRPFYAGPRHAYSRDLLTAARGLATVEDRLPSPAASTPESSAALLSVQGLGLHYGRGGRTRTALKDLSFTLSAGEILGVVGESGSGKTSLARIVAGLLRPSEGTVAFCGTPVAGLRHGARRAALQMVFQDPVGSLDPRQRVGAAVAEPLAVHEPGLSVSAGRERAHAMLDQVRLGALSDRYPHELSVGQCQRVALARALILRPRLLVLDEPVSALDASLKSELLALVAGLARAGTACLLISHNLAAVRAIATHVLVLLEGRVLESGPAAAVYGAPRHPYTRLLLLSAPVADPERSRPPLPMPAGIARREESCVFTARCAYAEPRCADSRPALLANGPRAVACHRADELPEASG